MSWARTRIDRPTGLARGFEDDAARAMTATMAEAGNLLKEGLREATWHANGWRNKLPKTWRLKVFPRGQNSIDAAAWVDTRAPKLMQVFAEGANIAAKGGKWLAIPTDAAGKQGLRADVGFRSTVNTRGARERVTPRGFERRTGLKLRFVAEGGAFAASRALLVVDQAKRNRATGVAAPYSAKGPGSKLYGPEGRTIVVFILVRQVRLKKKLDVAAEGRAVADRLPSLLAKHWRD